METHTQTHTQTHRHTDTQNDYRNPRCACAPRVNEANKSCARYKRTRKRIREWGSSYSERRGKFIRIRIGIQAQGAGVRRVCTLVLFIAFREAGVAAS